MIIFWVNVFFPITEQLPEYTDIGCYNAGSSKKRVLSTKLGNFQKYYDPNNSQSTIVPCAHVARDRGFKYFAILDKGFCMSDEDAGKKYDQLGEVDRNSKCPDGVGIIGRAMAVYQFKEE